ARDLHGTLTTILFDTADRTGDILQKAAETAATLALHVGGGPFGALANIKMIPPKDQLVQLPKQVIFDPCDESEVSLAQEILGNGISIDNTYLTSCGSSVARETSGRPKWTKPDIAKICNDVSVCFRTLARDPLVIKLGGDKGTLMIDYIDYAHV